jgi:hypothetical protein
MLQGKTEGSLSDNIITILRWEKHHTPHLAEEQKAMLAEQKNARRTKQRNRFSSLQPQPTLGTMCSSRFGSTR